MDATTETQRTEPSPAGGNGAAGFAAVGSRRHRVWLSPARLVAGALVILVSTVGFLELAGPGARVRALALARDVDALEAIGAADLRTVDVDAATAEYLVPVRERAALVGRLAVAPLTAGTLVSPALVIDRPGLGPGEALAGLSLPAGELPAPSLVPGHAVLAVETRGGAGAADDEAEALGIWPATVVSVGEGEETTGAPVTFVALRMATRAATALARAADEDRVRLVLVGDLDDVPGDLLFADRFAPQGEGEAPGAAPADDAGEEVGS